MSEITRTAEVEITEENQAVRATLSIAGMARLLDFVDEHTIAMDRFDGSNEPLKLLNLHDLTVEEVNLGASQTSDSHGIEGCTLAMGIGKQAVIFAIER